MLYNSNKSYGPKEAALQYSEIEQPPEDYYLNIMKQQFQTAVHKQPESDPKGLPPDAPGAKLDAGKDQPALVLGDFARALEAVVAIGSKGAVKYSPSGWIYVENGQLRYANARGRHQLARQKGELYDKDSGQLHLAHEAWNILAELELFIREAESGRANRTVAAA